MQIRNIDFIADLQGLPATGFIGYFGRANEDPMLSSNQLAITDGEGGAVATNPLIVGLNGGWVNNTASGTEVTPYIAETEYSLKIVSPEGGVLRHYPKIVADGGTGGGGGGVDSDYATLAIAQTSSILDSGFSSIYIVSELAPTGNGPIDGFYAYSDGTTGPASTGDAQQFYDVNGDGFTRNIEQRMPPRDSILVAADLTDPNAVLLAIQAGENVFEYTDGFLVRWDQVDINTGAMTIDLDGLGAKSVEKIDVNGASVDLESGDASGSCTAVYNLAADVFTLISTDSLLDKFTNEDRESLANGAATWNAVTNYRSGAPVFYDGNYYRARLGSINFQPDLNPTQWLLIGSSIGVDTKFTEFRVQDNDTDQDEYTYISTDGNILSSSSTVTLGHYDGTNERVSFYEDAGYVRICAFDSNDANNSYYAEFGSFDNDWRGGELRSRDQLSTDQFSAVEWNTFTALHQKDNLGIGINTRRLITTSTGGDLEGTWNGSVVSDIDLKENVTAVSGALDRICQLSPITWNWKNPELHNGQPEKGVSAQSWASAYPDQIATRPTSGGDAEIKEDYVYIKRKLGGQRFESELISAIQELKADIELIKAKVGL